jgi:hypothetical protein
MWPSRKYIFRTVNSNLVVIKISKRERETNGSGRMAKVMHTHSEHTLRHPFEHQLDY